MGFGVYGVKPDNAKGEYFRNNCWWWRPLWNFVCEVCADIITDEERDSGHFNNGYFIDERRALTISARLVHLIDQGEVKAYEQRYVQRLKELPDEKCWLCKGTGKRKDMIVPNGCNSCRGTGKIRPTECSYPFSEDNVKEFAKFCKYSGGFEIN